MLAERSLEQKQAETFLTQFVIIILKRRRKEEAPRNIERI